MTPLTDDHGLRVTGVWMCHSLHGTDGLLFQAKVQENAQYMPTWW